MDDAQVDRLIDDLEASYDWQVDGARRVRDLLAGLPAEPAAALARGRLTLLTVDEVVRSRSAGEAATVIVGVRDVAVRAGSRSLEARAERELSSLFREVGASAAALEHAVAALALDGDDLDPRLRAVLRLAMADALDECGSLDDARHRYREALERARALDEPWTTLLVLNNWACAELVAQHLDEAAALVDELRSVAAQQGQRLTVIFTSTVADVLHATGRSQEAITLLRADVADERPQSVYATACTWLSLALIERETGDLEAAGASLGTAERLTDDHALHGLRVEAMGSRAELLAAAGDHAGAYALHRRFHAETLELRSRASETHAKTLHAMLEIDETRRESARYRELSYHDSLTGLLNRRFVDEDLDRRLGPHATAEEDLTVALIDLDHFKRVNDTCSHEAGDAVLVRLAALLEETAASAHGAVEAYAARLGGEEFLLVLPGVRLPAGREVAERLRRRIAALDWSALAPGIPVTASVGLASTAPGSAVALDRASLLRTADEHLYAAKDGGRNRVEPAPVPVAGAPPRGRWTR